MNPRMCSSSWSKSTSTFSAALASMIEAVNVSCHLVLVFLATFALRAKTTLPASLLLSDTYESSKLSIRYALNSCVKDSLSNTPRRFCHRSAAITHSLSARPIDVYITLLCNIDAVVGSITAQVKTYVTNN